MSVEVTVTKSIPVPVLDHGYVTLIDHWGSDEQIIEAARMSTGKGFQGWGEHHALTCPCIHPKSPGSPFGGECNCTPTPGDEKLLHYLYTHSHLTPFEQSGFTVEVQAPIFVFREWHRHRTQSYNELSSRYTPLPDVNYIPSIKRLMMAGGSNKQAQGLGTQLTAERAHYFQCEFMHQYNNLQHTYEMALAEGVPKELARIILPVGRYSRMRASANLRNWLQFLTLRLDIHAQWEIRQYAEVVALIVKHLHPRTYDLFEAGLNKH